MAEYFDEESGSWLEAGAYEELKKIRESKKAEIEGEKAAGEAARYVRGQALGVGIPAGVRSLLPERFPAKAAEAIAGAGTFAASMASSFANSVLGVPSTVAEADARGKLGSNRGGETGWEAPPGTMASDRALPGGVPVNKETLDKLNRLRAKGIDVDHLVKSGEIWKRIDQEPEPLPGEPIPEVVTPPEGTFKETTEAPAVIDADTAGYLRNPRLAALERANEKRREVHGDVQGVLADRYFTTEEEGGDAWKQAGAIAPIIAGAVASPHTVIPALAGAMGTHAAVAPVAKKWGEAAGVSDPEAAGEEFGTLMSFGPGMAGGHAMGSMLAKRYPKVGGLGWTKSTPMDVAVREGKGQLPLDFENPGKPVPRLFEAYDKKTGTPLRHFNNENEALMFAENAKQSSPGALQVGVREAAEAAGRAVDAVGGRVGAARGRLPARGPKAGDIKVPEEVEAQLAAEAQGEAAKAKPPSWLRPVAGAAGYTAGATVGGPVGLAVGGPMAAITGPLAGHASGRLGSLKFGKFAVEKWRERYQRRLLEEKRKAYASGERRPVAEEATPDTGLQTRVDAIAKERGGLSAEESAEYKAMVDMLVDQGLKKAEAQEAAKVDILGRREGAEPGAPPKAGVPETAAQGDLFAKADSELAAEAPAKGAAVGQGPAGEALAGKTGAEPTPTAEAPTAAPEAPQDRVEVLSGNGKGQTGVVVERKPGQAQDKAGKGKRPDRVKVRLDDGTEVTVNAKGTRKVKAAPTAETPAAPTPEAPTTAVGEGKAGKALAEKTDAGKPPEPYTGPTTKEGITADKGWKAVKGDKKNRWVVKDREGNLAKAGDGSEQPIFTNKKDANAWAYKESLNPKQAVPEPGSTIEISSLDDVSPNLRGAVERAYREDGITSAQARGEAAGLSPNWAYTLARDVEQAASKAEGKPPAKTPTAPAPAKAAALPKVDTVPGLKAKMAEDGNKWTVEKQGDKWAVKDPKGKVKGTHETEIEAWNRAENRGRPKTKAAESEPAKKTPTKKEKVKPDEYGLVPDDYARVAPEGGGKEALPIKERAPGNVGELDHTPVESSGFVSYGYKDGVLEVAQSPKKGSTEATVYRYHGVTPEAMGAVEAAVKKGEGVGAALRAATKIENPRTIRRPNWKLGEAEPPGTPPASPPAKSKKGKTEKPASSKKSAEVETPPAATPTEARDLSFPDWLEQVKGRDLKTAPPTASPEYKALQEEYSAWKKGGGTKPAKPTKRRVNIKGVLADPVARREMMIETIIATQEREGIKTTRAQAEAAYDKVRNEGGGKGTSLAQDLKELKGELKKAKTAEEKADLQTRIDETQKLIAEEKKARPTESKEKTPTKKPEPAPEKPVDMTEGDWYVQERPDGRFILVRKNGGKLEALKKKAWTTGESAANAAEKRNVDRLRSRADKAASEAGAGKPSKPAKPVGPEEAPADVTMPDDPAAIRVAADAKGIGVKSKGEGVWDVVEKGSQRVLKSYKGKNAQAAALRFAEKAEGPGKKVDVLSPARATAAAPTNIVKPPEGKALTGKAGEALKAKATEESGSLKKGDRIKLENGNEIEVISTSYKSRDFDQAIDYRSVNKETGKAFGPTRTMEATRAGGLERVAKPEPKVTTETPAEVKAETGDGTPISEYGLKANDDGTVTLYHGTTEKGAAEISRTGKLKSAGEPDVYLTTDPKGGGYGDRVVKVRVDPKKLKIDDEFPGGRVDFRVSGKEAAVSVEALPPKPTGKALGEGKAGTALKGKTEPTPTEPLKPSTPESQAKQAKWDAEAKAAAAKAEKAEKGKKPVKLTKDQQTLVDEFGHKESFTKDLSEAQAKKILEAERRAKATQEKATSEKARKFKPGDKHPNGKYVHEVDKYGSPTVYGKTPPSVDKAKIARQGILPTETTLTVASVENAAPFWKGRVEQTKNGFVVNLPDGKIHINQRGYIEMQPHHAEAHGYRSVAEAKAADVGVEGRTRVKAGSRTARIDVTNLDALNHEPYHAFEALFATPKEMKVSNRAARKRLQKAGKDITPQSLSEESAKAFEEYRKADLRTRLQRQKTPLGRLHQRILDFFNKVKDSVYLTEEGVFRRVLDKKTWERKGVSTSEHGFALDVDAASAKTAPDTNRAAMKYNEENAIVSPEEFARYKESIESVAAIIHRSSERLDYHALEGQSVLRVNGDARYPTSRDYTTQCRRRYELSDTVDDVQVALGRMLEADDVLAIRKALESEGYEVSCGPCYVESRRIKMDTAVDKAIEGYWRNKKGAPKGVKEFVKLSKANAKRARSQEGRDWMYENDRSQYNIVSASFAGLNAKVPIGRSAYASDYLKLSEAKIAEMNRLSGARANSWSDFEVPHALDTMQAVLDMSLRKLKGHSYTKEIEYVELMKATGEMINMSLIPEGKTGFDAKGNLLWNEKQSVRDMKRARQIREKYNNVGFEGIAINDKHLLALLESNEIDYVIPYHVSGLSGKHAKMAGVEGWRNYESKKLGYKGQVPEQNWTDLRTGKKLDDVAREVFVDEWRGDYAKLWKLAKEREVLPPFLRFKDHPNYYKLLTDRRMFDANGNYIVQKPVEFNFDMKYVNKMLAKYKGGHAERHGVSHVVDRFSKELRNKKPSQGKTKKLDKEKVKNESIAAAQSKMAERVRRLREQGKADRKK